LIVFDLDDTLIDTSGSVTPFLLERLLKMMGVESAEALEEVVALNQTTFSSKETIRQTLEKHDMPHLFDQALALFTSPLPENFLIATTPHAKKVLSTLHREGHTLALVTGGTPSFQLEKFEKAGLEASIFSKIAVPEDSYKKPYYEALLRESLELPQRCFVVGDRVPMDLVPAHELGCHTVHMRWGRGRMWEKEDWIDYSIQELSELLELLT
jgi:putative hydrolase of the HAD superfamily